MVGQFGVNGIPVVNLAEQVYKNGLGTVRSQRPCITESLVRGNCGKTASAMRMRVLVCKLETSRPFQLSLSAFSFRRSRPPL